MSVSSVNITWSALIAMRTNGASSPVFLSGAPKTEIIVVLLVAITLALRSNHTFFKLWNSHSLNQATLGASVLAVHRTRSRFIAGLAATDSRTRADGDRRAGLSLKH
jgi:hypothetical protein